MLYVSISLLPLLRTNMGVLILQ